MGWKDWSLNSSRSKVFFSSPNLQIAYGSRPTSSSLMGIKGKAAVAWSLPLVSNYRRGWQSVELKLCPSCIPSQIGESSYTSSGDTVTLKMETVSPKRQNKQHITRCKNPKHCHNSFLWQSSSAFMQSMVLNEYSQKLNSFINTKCKAPSIKFCCGTFSSFRNATFWWTNRWAPHPSHASIIRSLHVTEQNAEVYVLYPIKEK